mmetsp:Transcript_73171/g.211843  ORF Transcript_73171/g.211843 Transcript_73171/m.211843 type:complete len:249 (+) Transcript_73171:823-1569(+)
MEASLGRSHREALGGVVDRRAAGIGRRSSLRPERRDPAIVGGRAHNRHAVGVIEPASRSELARARLHVERAIDLIGVQRVTVAIQGLIGTHGRGCGVVRNTTLGMVEPARRSELALARLQVKCAVLRFRVQGQPGAVEGAGALGLALASVLTLDAALRGAVGDRQDALPGIRGWSDGDALGVVKPASLAELARAGLHEEGAVHLLRVQWVPKAVQRRAVGAVGWHGTTLDVFRVVVPAGLSKLASAGL